jgi:hypothetical protein
VLVAETPTVVSATEQSRLWWFDGDCGTRGFSTLEGATSWQLWELASLPDTDDPSWLVSRADGDERGVLIFSGDPGAGSVSSCGRVDALDEADAWTAAGGDQPLAPHALALSEDGHGLAVGVGPSDYELAGPGYGSLWWVELDYAQDPCTAASTASELGASAPAVDAGLPRTWRRGPNVVHVIEVQG